MENTPETLTILAIETSCDETAAAIVYAKARHIYAQTLTSEILSNAPFGGVVPELTARAHQQHLPQIVSRTLQKSGLNWSQIDAIAATTGPGLTTALVIGSTFAKTLAVATGKPFLAVNHIEGHALTPHLTNPVLTFPYLLLLVSGGHCQLVNVKNVGDYELLGTTLDDAVGECFDKVGKLLGLPHPAGPALEKLAQAGNPKAIPLPHPLRNQTLNFSFSGLKTAVREYLAKNPNTNPADVAASFQATAAEILASKTAQAIQHTNAKQVVAAGGVAANQLVRTMLQQVCQTHGATFTAPPLNLCTDNAVMIAYAAGLRHMAKLPNGSLTTSVRPRWPLTEAHY